jgi:hypothetical protein
MYPQPAELQYPPPGSKLFRYERGQSFHLLYCTESLNPCRTNEGGNFREAIPITAVQQKNHGGHMVVGARIADSNLVSFVQHRPPRAQTTFPKQHRPPHAQTTLPQNPDATTTVPGGVPCVYLVVCCLCVRDALWRLLAETEKARVRKVYRTKRRNLGWVVGLLEVLCQCNNLKSYNTLRDERKNTDRL